MTEIDDGAVAVSDDASEFGDRRRHVQAQPPGELDVRFPDRKRLADLSEIGMPDGEPFQDRPVRRGIVELPVNLAIDENVRQATGCGKSLW